MDGTDIRRAGGGRSRRAASVWVPEAVPVPASEAPSPGTAQYSGQLAGKASQRRRSPGPDVTGAVGQILKGPGQFYEGGSVSGKPLGASSMQSL